MKVIRFRDRVAIPKKFKAGVELDNIAEQIKFELPQFADGQHENFVWENDYSNIEELDDGVLTVTNAMSQYPGLATCYITINVGETLMWHSELFYMDIISLPDTEERIVQEFPGALMTAVLRAEDAQDAAEDAQEAAEDAQTAAETAQAAAETAQGAAEAAQAAAEAAQGMAEAAQSRTETLESSAAAHAQLAATSATAAAASATAAAESAEDAAESATDAAGCVTAAAGKANDAAASAAAAAATAAQIVTDEATRQANETARTLAEASRAAAEEDREDAESARETAETTRTNAESARMLAEASRQSTEGTRANNETARQTAEAARVSAETARETAEAARESASAAAVEEAEDAADAANAAAEAVSGEVDALKSALMVAKTHTLAFMQGGISSSTGSASNTNYEKRIRTVSNTWYNVAGGLTCTVPNGFRAVFYYYDYNAAGNNYTYKGPSDGWVIGEYTDTTPIGDYLRVVLAREDDTNLTPADVTTPVTVEALTATDETLSIPGKAADAKTVNEAIASCYKYGGLINENTDLDDLKTPGLYYRWTSSHRPGNCPTVYGGSVLCFGHTGVNYQLVINSAGNLFARGTTGTGDGSYTETWIRFAKHVDEKDQLHFSVVKGAWSKKGTIGVSGVLGICCDHIFQLTPNSVLEFYLDEGWTYTIREGLAAGELNEMTAHLSNARLHTIKYPYVAINFNRWEDGETVYTDVDDFDGSVIIRTSGAAAMETTEDDGIYHDFPETVGQMNVISRAYQMAKIQYTTEAVLPLHSGGSKQVDIRDADPETDITGIPYSSMRETMASVPQATSFHTFMTAALNKNSYLYTKHYEQGAPLYDYNSRCYYGAVCSTLVAYCYGIEDVIPTTISFDTYPGLNPLPSNQQNPYSLKLADMLNHSNDHIVIVTDIGRNYRGKIEYIEVTEAWKPLCRSVKYTPERIKTKYFDGGFVAYRYEYVDDVSYTPSPWVHIDNTEKDEPVYSTTLSPRKGDKANWALGETVEIDVMDSAGYTSYVLENAATETVISTASIPAGNVISLTGLTEGKYSVYLTDGTENGVPVYFDVIDAEVTYTPLGNNQVKVEYTSASNRVPSAVYWCANVQSGSDYKAVRAFHILTSEEISAGYAIVDEPTDYRDADTVNGVWRMRMNFKTEFGLFASEMVEVSVT